LKYITKSVILYCVRKIHDHQKRNPMDNLQPGSPIYLDYNATTPVDPRVAAAMRPFLEGSFGNPSSHHTLGLAARSSINTARSQLALMLAASPEEIIFTSGGTEANNHAIIGAALSRRKERTHIITSAVEHPAVLEVCRSLESRGFSVTKIGVDKFGMVDAGDVIAAMTPETALVTIMLANNEVGTIQPIAEIAEAARTRGILSHTDCAQAVGKVPVHMTALGVDMLSVASHKFYGPKGVGALCLLQGINLPPLMFGAGHENGRRPGTENILGIVGMGMASELVVADLDQGEASQLAALRDRLQAALCTEFPDAIANGHPSKRLPNTLSISFPGRRSVDILAGLPSVAVSAGAACHGASIVLTDVLQAMGVNERDGMGTLRISVGRFTTEDEVATALPDIIRAVSSASGMGGM
jgi:cysteine desulfurase